MFVSNEHTQEIALLIFSFKFCFLSAYVPWKYSDFQLLSWDFCQKYS